MAKKKRLSGDTFAWVKDTTTDAEEQKREETTTAKPEKLQSQKAKAPKAASKAGAIPEEAANVVTAQQRAIFVKFETSSGVILATQELAPGREQVNKNPWSTVPPNQRFHLFELTGDLLTKELIEIHSAYRVDSPASPNPELVPK